jgi:hypothetical protein
MIDMEEIIYEELIKRLKEPARAAFIKEGYELIDITPEGIFDTNFSLCFHIKKNGDSLSVFDDVSPFEPYTEIVVIINDNTKSFPLKG